MAFCLALYKCKNRYGTVWYPNRFTSCLISHAGCEVIGHIPKRRTGRVNIVVMMINKAELILAVLYIGFNRLRALMLLQGLQQKGANSRKAGTAAQCFPVIM